MSFWAYIASAFGVGVVVGAALMILAGAALMWGSGLLEEFEEDA